MNLNVYARTTVCKGEDIHFNHDLATHILVGVADGHGGAMAARLCKTDVCGIVTEKMESANAETRYLENVLTSTISELHKRCCALNGTSGCTLTIALIHKETRKYVCANVGDSLALHVSPTTYKWITVSHRLQDNASECQRLKENISNICGPDNVPYGPPRLFPGGIAVSRSVGDSDCPYVSCEPNICSGTLKNEDALVICSDGVWDSARCTKILKVVRDSYNPEFLCRLAQRRAIQDDATALIVTDHKMKTSIHTQLFSLFSRSGSSSSVSSEDSTSALFDEKSIMKVNVDT